MLCFFATILQPVRQYDARLFAWSFEWVGRQIGQLTQGQDGQALNHPGTVYFEVMLLYPWKQVYTSFLQIFYKWINISINAVKRKSRGVWITSLPQAHLIRICHWQGQRQYSSSVQIYEHD